MTQKCEVCGQIKPCIRRDYSYPTRHYEINCDDCHRKHREEVKKIKDRALWEAIFIADCNKAVSTKFKESE